MTRVVAFHLPQFHRIPQNDEWWYPGFSEWTVTLGARRLYPGHAQPKVPGELGFYDLDDDHALVRQARLAATAGVDAFCFWHYWFEGQRLLERPVERFRSLDEHPLDYCLGWANQPWTRVWQGRSRKVLQAQGYGGEPDDRAHYQALVEHFSADAYLRVDGRPVFYLYRPFEIESLDEFVTTWRSEADRHGLPPCYLIGEIGDADAAAGLDARGRGLLDDIVAVDWSFLGGRASRARRWVAHRPLRKPYDLVADHLLERASKHDALPVVLTGWDNTPRRGRAGWVAAGYEPASLDRAVRRARVILDESGRENGLLLVKSWNEWSEGNFLEPDAAMGRDFLEAFAKALEA